MKYDEKMFEFVSECDYYGFKRMNFKLNGRDAILVFPKVADEKKRWTLKTEYFEAFPAFQLEMLERGWHLAYIKNSTRWHKPEDDDAKELLCQFLQEKYGLNEKCLPIGMSCGGMMAVYFAAKYPHRVHGLYIDAPVMNLLSCPCGIGHEGYGEGLYQEFFGATGITISTLLNYRNHPIDNADKLLANNIPIFLICGDADEIVPYEENGKAFYEKYKAAGGEISLILKPDCKHHPHGLEGDQTPLVEFALKHS